MTTEPCFLLSHPLLIESGWSQYSFILRSTDPEFSALRVHGFYSCKTLEVVSLFASELSVDVKRVKQLGGHKGEIKLPLRARKALVPVVKGLLSIGYTYIEVDYGQI